MFAKPVAKKPLVPASKAKTPNKPKALSVKAGVKAPQNKKIKPDAKKSLKPPPRPDAGYCLYSSDSEDQVSVALNEMEACEKILTQIKSKQKELEKQHKPKGKKKKKENSTLPKALNENPSRSDIVPGFSSIYGTTYPYGTALFLRQLQTHDLANNPMFNSRLASSTPDPEKHVNDMSASKLPSTIDQGTQDIPERDISAVSSVPPSFNHLQNMADMVDIYKRLEFSKGTQLKEAAARAELEKFKAFQSASVKQTQSAYEGQDHLESQGQSESFHPGGQNVQHLLEGRESGGFVGTGSLGFPLTQGESLFRPVVSRSRSLDSIGALDGHQDSSLTAFQQYISGDSREILLPRAWMNLDPSQNQGHGFITFNVENGDNIQQRSEKTDENTGQEIPLTERTDISGASKDTEYVTLKRRSDVEGHEQRSRLPSEGKVVYEKHNGLFQLRKKTDSENNSMCNESRSDKSSSTSKGQGSLDEVPERDVPANNKNNSSKEGTFRVNSQKNNSQNSSGVTSTPRNQNTSVTGSTASSCGGRIVFIPNDSNTPNVIGYVPGLPVIHGTDQSICLPVTFQAPGNNSGSQSTSQCHSQGPQVTSQGQQEVTGYHSAAHAQAIAAGEIGVRKLRYLLKELKECTRVAKDVEVSRLVTEIDTAVNSIPQLALTFNLQTEIDLAIQPLRSENSQLRRKLRLLNQQVKDKELASNEEPKDINFEILHLQTANASLQKVVKDEREIKTRLAAEVHYLYQEIHKMKVEKSKLIAQTSEKETEQLKIRQEMTLETQKLKHDLDLIKKDQETMGNKLESIEKENHILQITLKQRDEEISRQSEIVETMKESISELLGELEQSRIGEKTWDHNTSYGLHRLLKIVEEGGESGLPKGAAKRVPRSPERQVIDFNNSDSTSSTTRLTRAALAFHNNKHKPAGGRMGLDGRQGPASESELDTLVEMHLREKLPQFGQGRQPAQPRRRTTSSSPVRFRHEQHVDNLRHQRTGSSPTYNRGRGRDAGGTVLKKDSVAFGRPRKDTIGQESDADDENGQIVSSPPRRQEMRQEVRHKQSPQRRVQTAGENVSPKRRVPFSNYEHSKPDSGNGSEVSVEQSRYSVTDYFKKYHPQDSTTRAKEAYSELPGPSRTKPIYSDRGINEYTSRPLSQFRTSSEIDDRTAKSSEASPVRNVYRGKFFKGSTDDQTISAIHDDDAVSSVSMLSVTTANTVDDRKFRSGIATLDANIARLQQALQKTKSMLT